uniref:Uncharacterized protein n=1 Tax=Aureoumbra lagunensis TaxID=44058 RepID=A0A7S3NRG2_9STRA|mmetsp:Transcript_1461/g.1936  ORF Transcript_1461/g.1936 Transcript_1461/m.1936 type:complete len:112 (+) Transcript_1461:89-424(+)
MSQVYSQPIHIPSAQAQLPDEDYSKVLDYQLYRFSRRISDGGISVSSEDLQPRTSLLVASSQYDDAMSSLDIPSYRRQHNQRGNQNRSPHFSHRHSRTASSELDLIFGLDL